MRRDTTKRFYIIHSWLGALTAVLLFVICYTGAVSVFGRPELKIWSNTELHHAASISPAQLEEVVRQRAKEVPEAYLSEISILIPGITIASNLVVLFENEVTGSDGVIEHHMIRFEHDPASLELISRQEGPASEMFRGPRRDMADFLTKFHADLHLGSPFGLMLTGVLGLTLFGSVVTGVITHRKILREALRYRPRRSLRLLFTDSHKLFGVWGLPFHITIGFTGAFLGLAAVVLLPAAAFVSYGGDLNAMVDTFLPSDVPERSGRSTQLQFADVLHQVNEGENGAVTFITLLEPTDENGRVVINTLAGREMTGEVLRYLSQDATLEDSYTTFGRLGGFAGPALDVMFPLHFGNFGGVVIKGLWFVLGIGSALLAVTGMMIWIERRLHSAVGSMAREHYVRICDLVTGACCGVVIAVAILFPAQRLLSVPDEASGFWLGSIFFSSWMLGILWALLRHDAYRATRELLMLAGVTQIFTPFLGAWITGNHAIFGSDVVHPAAIGVDIALLVTGALLVAIGIRLPSTRPLRKLKDEQIVLQEPEPAEQPG